MSSSALSPSVSRGPLTALFVFGLAAAAGVAVFRPSQSPYRTGALGRDVARQAGNTATKLKALGATVEQIFESRSPGERLGGGLVSLKPARRPAIHERALP